MLNYFPGSKEFYEKIVAAKENTTSEFVEIFEGIINLLELSLQIFIVATIRAYENKFVNTSEETRKKVRPITEILSKRYRSPTLGTIVELARGCFFLIEQNNCPDELKRMWETLNSTIKLDDYAFILRDLDLILSNGASNTSDKKPAVYLPAYKMKFFQNMLAKMVEYRNEFKHGRDLSLALEDYQENKKLDIIEWRNGFNILSNYLGGILNNKYTIIRRESIKTDDTKVIEDSNKDLMILGVSDYYNGSHTASTREMSLNEYLESSYSKHEELSYLSLNTNGDFIMAELFPFLIIINNHLAYYKRTTAMGYEYYDVVTDKVELKRTKRKFNHSIFRAGFGDQQVLFWTEVLPEVNKLNGVKANIPTEGRELFVGRKKQIKKIMDEVIEIPNRDGIIFGPGGVGKTSLMRQLSKELYNEDISNVNFKNIIWVSAKTNYYNPVFDDIVNKEQQFDGLDKILTIIMRFFELENVDEYEYEDKKEFVKQLSYDNKILLIIDNFETVTKKDQKEIIDFFGLDIKKFLKKKPDNLKVIITSRELIPSGFQQLKLEGLDLRESKLLINQIFERYKDSKSPLSDEQKVKIHEATNGVPILIIHVMAQLFEFNNSLDFIIRSLPDINSNILKFSFAELFKSMSKDDILLKIIILLEIYDSPLLSRQIGDILEIQESELLKKLPLLVSFQCLDILNEGVDQKYIINKNQRILTKGLAKDYPRLVLEIKELIKNNFTHDRKIDYSTEEYELWEIFNSYVNSNDLLKADVFIQEQLKKYPSSLLLKYEYSKYLIETKGEPEKSIQILSECLDDCKKFGKSNVVFLQTIIKAYLAFQLPDYATANSYVNELNSYISEGNDIKLDIAEFYIRWSTNIKMLGSVPDPIKEIKRKSEYKDLANKGLSLLRQINSDRNHNYYYLKSIAEFNNWENETALNDINKAIELIKGDPKYFQSYANLRMNIQKAINRINKLKHKNGNI